MDEKELIAKNVQYYRRKLGLSQLELAEKLQYSNKNVSKWENGETTPSIFTLKRLAEVFGITVDELISPIKEDNKNNVSTQEKPKRKGFFATKIMFLLLANACLLVLACIAIMVLAILEVSSFNYWLILLYITPLSAISVFVFIVCIKKRVEIISLSLAGWLTALSLFLTFRNTPSIGLVFVLMATIQLLMICIMLIINLFLSNREKKKISNNN